jgi:hypothetical protein
MEENRHKFFLVCKIIQKFPFLRKGRNAFYHHRYINNKLSMVSLSLTSIKVKIKKISFPFPTPPFMHKEVHVLA